MLGLHWYFCLNIPCSVVGIVWFVWAIDWTCNVKSFNFIFPINIQMKENSVACFQCAVRSVYCIYILMLTCTWGLRIESDVCT